jgi:transcriptional regulator with XRE-family HTH domain
MSVHTLKNKIAKRTEKRYNKSDFSDIGSLIKRKRKELKVTQDEIANGICSISYLSKIENNQIVPSDMYVKEIMNRLEINSDLLEKSIKEREYIEQMIEAIFDLNDDFVLELYEQIKDIEHSVAINICKLGKTIFFNENDDNQYVMMLEHVVNNMSDLELEFYLYLSTMFFVSRQKFKSALEIIILYDRLIHINPKLNALFSEISYIVKVRLNKKLTAIEDFHSAVTLYQKYHNITRLMVLEMKKIEEIADENPMLALEKINVLKTNNMRTNDICYYHFLKAKIFYGLKRYSEASFELKKIGRNSRLYYRKMTMLLELCIKEGDQTTSQEIKKVLSDINPSPNEIDAKIKYHYLTQTSKEDKKEYLRDIAIPFSIRIEDYKMLHAYTLDIMDICIETSRYKEATSFYQKYVREKEKINLVLSY